MRYDIPSRNISDYFYHWERDPCEPIAAGRRGQVEPIQRPFCLLLIHRRSPPHSVDITCMRWSHAPYSTRPNSLNHGPFCASVPRFTSHSYWEALEDEPVFFFTCKTTSWQLQPWSSPPFPLPFKNREVRWRNERLSSSELLVNRFWFARRSASVMTVCVEQRLA